MPDNYIRLKQLHNPEISGYVIDVLAGTPTIYFGGDITVSGDFSPGIYGVYYLGSSDLPFQDLYLGSGDSLYFGGDKLSVSGSYLLINGDPFSVDVTGPPGEVGITGPSGATGVAG